MASGAFAGLVDGFTRGLNQSRQWAREDEERQAREEDRAFLREQRGLTRKAAEDDARIASAVQNVPTTTEKWGDGYADAATRGAPMRDDDGNVMPGAQSTPRSARQVYADQAAAVRGIGGLRGVLLSNQLQGFANAEADRDEAAVDRVDARKLRDIQLRSQQINQQQQELLNGVKRAGALLRMGSPRAAVEMLAQSYGSFPDGMKLIVEGNTVGRAGPDGKWVDPPVSITQENAAAMVNHAFQYADPAAWAKVTEVGDNRAYRKGLVDYYQGRNQLDRDEFNAKNAGGMFTRSPSAADTFSPIGLSDDSTRILGRVGSRLVEQPVPSGYSKMFPKVTGERPTRPTATKFLKSGEDGTHTAYGDNGKPLFNLLPNGLEAPLGVTGDSWRKQEQLAGKAGVRAALGKGPDGSPMVAYIGRDGQPYSTLEEAAAAKPATK